MHPGVLGQEARQVIIVILAIFVILSFFSRLLVVLKKDQPHLVKFLKKSYIFWLVNAVILAIWLFFRMEAVPLFGSRFWMLIVGLIDIYWLYLIISYAIKGMPKEKQAREEKKQFNKYLPR